MIVSVLFWFMITVAQKEVPEAGPQAGQQTGRPAGRPGGQLALGHWAHWAHWAYWAHWDHWAHWAQGDHWAQVARLIFTNLGTTKIHQNMVNMWGYIKFASESM